MRLTLPTTKLGGIWSHQLAHALWSGRAGWSSQMQSGQGAALQRRAPRRPVQPRCAHWDAQLGWPHKRDDPSHVPKRGR